MVFEALNIYPHFLHLKHEMVLLFYKFFYLFFLVLVLERTFEILRADSCILTSVQQTATLDFFSIQFVRGLIFQAENLFQKNIIFRNWLFWWLILYRVNDLRICLFFFHNGPINLIKLPWFILKFISRVFIIVSLLVTIARAKIIQRPSPILPWRSHFNNLRL